MVEKLSKYVDNTSEKEGDEERVYDNRKKIKISMLKEGYLVVYNNLI